MRSDAKASTAGSTKRQASSLGRIIRGALATRASSPGDPGSGASAARRLAIPTAVLAAIVAGLVALAGLAAAATSAITEPATEIGGTHATLNGIVNPEGVEPEECFFEWGEGFSGAYTETTPCAETPAEIGSGSTGVPVHAEITGLTPQGTYYHFRLVVVDPSETHYGASQYFRTLYTIVTEEPTSNTGTRATLAGSVNPEGVEPEECFFEWGEGFSGAYTETTPCAETPAEIGSGSTGVPVHAEITGLTPQGTYYHFRLVVVDPSETLMGFNTSFQTPNTVLTTAPSGITDTEATLNGTVNPDTATISECVFEWGTPKTVYEPTQTFPNAAPCVPGPGSITGESPVAVHADLSGLHPGTTYVYRLKATYPTGPAIYPKFGQETVQTAGPLIADSWAEDVTVTEALLKAEIDPEGAATTYRFEYGPTDAYGTATEELNVASDSSVHTVLAALTGLQPGTEYHWRVVATSAGGENAGPDHQLRTYRRFAPDTSCPNQANRYGAGANLPDCRAYEMVSPVDKNDGDIRSLQSGEVSWSTRRTESTPSGDKLTYSSATAFADTLSAPYNSQYIARRLPGGWETHAINPPQADSVVTGIAGIYAHYEAFSEDLCQGWMMNTHEPLLAPAGIAGIRNIYRREDRLCGSEGFEAVGPVVATAFGNDQSPVRLEGVSDDGSQAIFTSSRKLAPEGTEGQTQLYESTEPEAAPRLVCILPNGEPYASSCAAGTGDSNPSGGSPAPNRISADGSRIFWSAAPPGTFAGGGPLYVRIDGGETVAVSAAGEAETGTTKSWFEGASADGSRALYTTDLSGGGNKVLFAFDVDSEATERIAAGVYGVAAVSDDAHRVYFLSREVLPGSGTNSEGEQAIEDRPNLYLYDADSEGAGFAFIGTLTSADAGLTGSGSPVALEVRQHLATATADGRYLAFAAFASLTGYDNEGGGSGILNDLAYVYDSQSDQLVCASCIPSGARGGRDIIPDGGIGGGLLRAYETFMLPLRSLVAGRLFFSTNLALTPRDANGKLDVYEWEQAGVGGCDAADSTYAPSAEGCVSLISSGTSEGDSEFAEASATGEDVFFYTTSNLVPQDFGRRDIYVASAGGGFPLPPEAPECVGDTCQSIPAAPNDQTPASASFHGAGDPAPRRNCRASARRATRLSRRAKHLRRAARRSSAAKRKKALRRRSGRSAKAARRLSKNAKRCRRANRRAGK